MSIGNKFLFGAAVAAALAIAAVFISRGPASEDQRSGNTEKEFVEIQPTVKEGLGSRADGPREEPSSTAVARRSTAALEQGYRWNPVDPGIAESAEDAGWLAARGYPGPEVERHLMSLPESALRDLAAEGNQSAQSVLAYRLAQSGAPVEEVMAILEDSAAGGSVYALKMTADIFQTVPQFKNPELARAYYGLMVRRGDHGGLIANATFGSGLSSEQVLRAQVLEEMLWRKLLADRDRLLGRPFDPSLRPSFISLIERVQSTEEGEGP